MRTPAPVRCPGCGCGLKYYWPESLPGAVSETWGFACNAEVARAENGKLFVENDCELVFTRAVDALNIAAVAQSPQGSEQPHD